ncbi:MAG: response regulator transcription factor [Candidatus Nanopelagicales bacterium]
MRILIVEDDHVLRRSLAVALRTQGFGVFDAADGRSALRAVQAMPYDVILLDLGLPDIDGVALLPQLRYHHAGPVIVLSARRDQSDKVAALDAGADDYMTKPFGLPELLARIRAAARRAGVGAVVRTASFAVDLAREEVTDANGTPVALTSTEWAVLAVLARAGGAPVTAEDLLDRVWGSRVADQRNYVRQYVNLLRRKLEPDPARPTSLLSQPGRGYWLAIEG